MTYNKPYIEKLITDPAILCEYGCNTAAQYKFRNGKLCCSSHYNSCQGKIKVFSELDHSSRTAKSLETRTRLGITKTSQVKGGKTRTDSGHYERLAKTMRQHWEDTPWQNNTHCPILRYKDTELVYQGSYEYNFLAELEYKNSMQWILENVARGPCVWYNDPVSNDFKLYISDFIIGNTIYEIKSQWTWNKLGTDLVLENLNRAKLNECIAQGYSVVLVLDKKEQDYERIVDGTLSA